MEAPVNLKRRSVMAKKSSKKAATKRAKIK